MADTFTAHMLFRLQQIGGNDNSWGSYLNILFSELDDKLGSVTDISSTGGTTTLTEEQERVMAIELAGTLVSNKIVEFSGRGGAWIVRNSHAGGFTVTAKVTGQTGVVIEQGGAALIYCDGTDIQFGNPPTSETAEVTVASAATCNILAAASRFIAISGTTTITSFGTGANRERLVRATGAFKITHHATSLICPGGKSIQAQAGDTFMVVSDASSNVRVHHYQPAATRPPAATPIGTIAWCVRLTTPTGWLFADGRTIGNAASGGTALASNSPDTEELFTELWGSHANTQLPIQDSAGTATTRGASAAADFAANKRLPLPDVAGRVLAGRDNMSGTSANRLTNPGATIGGIDGDTLGNTGGDEDHVITEAQMDPHEHGPGSFSAASDGAHTHTTGKQGNLAGTTPGSLLRPTGEGSDGEVATSSNGAHTHTIIGASATTGSGAAHNNVQPTIIENCIIFAGVA